MHEGEVNVVGTVVVEASEWVGDNRWVRDLAKTNPAIVGFVGHAVTGRPEFADHLRCFAADLKRVAELDLALDVMVGAAILAPTLRLSRLLPGLRIVIDHAPFAAWDTDPAALRPALAELARQPNVGAKISNVVRG